MTIWVAEIRVSPSVETKINAKHHVTFDQVKEAVLCGAASEARWAEDPDGKPKLVARGRSGDGRNLMVILFPVDVTDGIWRLATALEV